jgi:holo-[acyl-carrier protein] synthase
VIVGSGIDIVEISRVERALQRRGERMRERLFTPRERSECARRRRPGPHLALRFAAKEAGMKAVGTGWRRGVRWLDFEVVEGEGRALHFSRQRGGNRVWLAAAYTRAHAMAQVVLERSQ